MSPNTVPQVSALLLAAEQGNAGAKYSLGVLYSNGHGMPQNDREAAAWYRLAADQKHAEAQYALARCYEQGRGVKQEPRPCLRLDGPSKRCLTRTPC